MHPNFFSYQRLALLSTLVVPATLLGLVLQPFVIGLLLTPPKGISVPERILSPRTTRDRIDRGYHLLKGKKDGEGAKEALLVLNEAIRLDPTSGDAFLCRGYVLSALGRKEEALSDVTRARTLFLTAGNGVEVKNIDNVYLPQIRSYKSL